MVQITYGIVGTIQGTYYIFPQPISISLKIKGRMAELAEGNKNYRQFLIKIFLAALEG